MFIEKKIQTGTTSGLMIAFIGQDGAGKSTISNEIVNWLRWKIDARKFYLGSGDHYHSWKKHAINKLDSIYIPFRKPLVGLLSVWDSMSLAHHTYKIIKRANDYVSKGGIAVFDRYPQIQFCGINDGPKIRNNMLPRISGNMIKKVVTLFAIREEKYLKKATTYQPNIVFKLCLSTEESLRRKPDEILENVQRKHDIVESLQFPCSKVYVIDAEQEFAKEILFIKNTIWKHLQGC